MNSPEERLNRVWAAARLANGSSSEAPPGFATRVVAHWAAERSSPLRLWERLAWRACGVAAAVAAAVAVAAYPAVAAAESLVDDLAVEKAESTWWSDMEG